MKDITIIMPIHKLDDNIKEMVKNAVDSVKENQKNYKDGKLNILVVSPTDVYNELNNDFIKTLDENISCLENTGNTDYCSQVNFAVDFVKTEHFSILEFDDTYTPKWFKCANDYYYGNESISVFLPVNLFHDDEGGNWQYGNTMALSPMFMTSDEQDTDDIGIINYRRLENCSLFNLTGAIFNTDDFKKVGKYKPSIKVAFNYEFLLRLTHKGLKAMVVPKEGYIHTMGRKDSLTIEYLETMNDSERDKWFDLAIRECIFEEDRNKTITSIKDEELK